MPEFEAILYETHGPVALVALNRPDKLNAFDPTQRDELAVALRTAMDDDAVRAVVLAGEGRAFSAGADLSAAKPGRDTKKTLMEGFKPSIDAILYGDKPVIAAAQGACAGVGAAYVMACDLAVMEADAYLYQAFAAIGLIPDGGTHWHLVRALGRKRAYEMIVSAGRLTAEEAKAAGLANRVVGTGEARKAALDWAAEIAQGAPRTLRFAKRALLEANWQTFDESYALEADLQNECSRSEDNANAVKAFFAKEKPVFTGA
jgi:2-(1,2-epoxy-1,2-dihydrophenyl)acetyl-CoA isomerase